ncbi:MAG: cytoplasmic protein [Myxococcales bacterium]|nr:MAG: cytoplasmic protein [Myxococcales bacterium]
MSSDEAQHLADLKVDTANLYREEMFTDLRVATLRRLVPVRLDGTDDPSRPILFSAQTTLMTQAGPVPVSAAIEATTLLEATQKFPEAIQAAVERLVEEARELQRREMSRIVVPGAMPAGPPRGKFDLG